MKQARADRHRRDHAIAMARLRELTERPLGPRRRRVQLAVAYVVAVVTMAAVMAFVPRPLPALLVQVVLLAAVMTLWFALRRSTRLVTEAPDEVLDELLVRLRDGFFRDAYRILGTATTLIGAALLVVGTSYGVSVAAAGATGWTLIALAPGLPLVVAAFQLPDTDDGS